MELITHKHKKLSLLTDFSDLIANSLCPVEQGWLQTYPKIFLSSGSCVMNDILLIGCSCCAFCNRKLKTWIKTHLFLQQVLKLDERVAKGGCPISCTNFNTIHVSYLLLGTFNDDLFIHSGITSVFSLLYMHHTLHVIFTLMVSHAQTLCHSQDRIGEIRACFNISRLICSCYN